MSAGRKIHPKAARRLAPALQRESASAAPFLQRLADFALDDALLQIVAAIGILMILTLLAIVAIFYKVSGRVGLQT